MAKFDDLIKKINESKIEKAKELSTIDIDFDLEIQEETSEITMRKARYLKKQDLNHLAQEQLKEQSGNVNEKLLEKDQEIQQLKEMLFKKEEQLQQQEEAFKTNELAIQTIQKEKEQLAMQLASTPSSKEVKELEKILTEKEMALKELEEAQQQAAEKLAIDNQDQQATEEKQKQLQMSYAQLQQEKEDLKKLQEAIQQENTAIQEELKQYEAALKDLLEQQKEAKKLLTEKENLLQKEQQQSKQQLLEKEQLQAKVSETAQEQQNLHRQIQQLQSQKTASNHRIHIVTSMRKNIGKSVYSIHLATQLSKVEATILIDFGKNNSLNLGEYIIMDSKEDNEKYFQFLEAIQQPERNLIPYAISTKKGFSILTNSMVTSQNYLADLNLKQTVKNILKLSKDYQVVIDINHQNKQLLEALLALPAKRILILQNDLYTIHQSLDQLDFSQENLYLNWTLIFNRNSKTVDPSILNLIDQKIDSQDIENLEEKTNWINQ